LTYWLLPTHNKDASFSASGAKKLTSKTVWQSLGAGHPVVVDASRLGLRIVVTWLRLAGTHTRRQSTPYITCQSFVTRLHSQRWFPSNATHATYATNGRKVRNKRSWRGLCSLRCINGNHA